MKGIACGHWVLAAALLLGCLPVSAGAQTKPLRFVMASTPSFTWLPFLVARQLTFEDLAKETGTRIEVTYSPTPSPALLALLAGEHEIGIMYVQHAIKAQAEKKDLVVLAALMENPTVALLARTDLPEIKSPADLKGRAVGIVGLGSGHHMIGLAVAKAYGVNPEDVTWRSTGGISGWIPSMRSKRVDAVFASEPTLSKLVDEGLGRVILDLHGREATEKVFHGPHPTVSIIVRREYANTNPRIVQAVVDAHLKTLKWIHAKSPQEIAAALPDPLGKEPNVDSILRRVLPAVSRGGEVTGPAVTITGDWMKRMDEIPKDFVVDPAKIHEPRFLQRSAGPRGSN